MPQRTILNNIPFEIPKEVLLFVGAFFSPILGILWSIGFLIMADTFTGIWAAKKKGVKIESRKAGRIVSKLILYPVAIMVAHVSQQHLAPEIPWTKVTSGIIATIEIKSIFENISDVLGYDLWKRIKERMWKDKVEDKAKEDA